MRPISGLIALVAWAVCGAAAMAEVRLGSIFSDGLVLQRDKPVPVWGSADPGEQVVVKFGGQEKRTTADGQGQWLVRLDPMPASAQGRELSAGSEKHVKVQDVLVGEVWVCAGDFGAYWEMFNVVDAEREVPAARNPMLRLLRVGGKNSNTPMQELTGVWKPCDPVSVEGFSALGNYFGARLQKELAVPVGIIDLSYRYSYTRGWMAPDGFMMVPELSKGREKMESWDPKTATGTAAFNATLDQTEKWLAEADKALAQGKPVPKQPRFPAPLPATDVNYLSNGELSLLFYGMVCPVKPYAIRGLVWSIGEGGEMEMGKYRWYLKGLVEGWRKAWGGEEFPVLVELLPQVNKPPDRTAPAPQQIDGWTAFRLEQAAAVAVVKNLWVVGAHDVSDFVSDRRDRATAGRRLAQQALTVAYGRPGVAGGPVAREAAVNGDTVVVQMDHFGQGLAVAELNSADAKDAKKAVVEGFTLRDKAGKWHWAQGRIQGAAVIVKSPAVTEPTAVRYGCFSNPGFCNLVNRDGFIAVPFEIQVQAK